MEVSAFKLSTRPSVAMCTRCAVGLIAPAAVAACILLCGEALGRQQLPAATTTNTPGPAPNLAPMVALPAPPADESVLAPRELIRLLDSASFAQRERAAAALLELPHRGLAEIEKHIASDNLSPEQMARLEPIALELMVRTPRAGMGVQFDNQNPEMKGVPLMQTIEGFHAAEVLRPGDVILSIAGIPVSNLREARYAILSHDPGDQIAVEIQRKGEPLNVTVVAGSYEDLNNAGRGSLAPDELRIAWQYRIARMRSASPAQRTPIALNITPDDWRLMNDAVALIIDAQLHEATVRHADLQRENPSFRLATNQIDPAQPPRIAAGGADRNAALEAAALFRTDDEGLADVPQILELQRQIDSYVVQIRRNERLIADPRTLPAERERLQRRNADYIGIITRLRVEQRQRQGNLQP